ncbi:glycoside hydrolase TIM-barrel-like domain-containing protein [Pseudotabrizicola sp. 4114]|uniref:baseplate multidomain protein megatron n=1 Tax=Pseudotabrizicola sp. 4114 TaxID=2817731 RepID=UPI002865F007|nr:hypothetical protein [Pseudorhodobacter sp. 4114]
MATIVFAAAGAALGAGFGGTVLGLSGAVVGRALGATLGRAVDQRIMGFGSDAVEVGRLDRFHIMGASEGAPIPKFWGRMRLPGQVIWASPFRETSRKSGGKGMPSPKTVEYSYSVSLAIALCEGEILGIGRIWADGDEISPKSLNIRVYNGTEVQLPDPLLEAHLGNSFAPAYRGVAYVVLEELELAAYGNRVPQFSFEVMRRAQGAEAEKVPDLQDAIRAVALIPGTGEYALSTRKVVEEKSFSFFRVLNVNAPSGGTDLQTSLDQLTQELPKCQAVSLVVSWFGNDLRCGFCDVQPKVERNTDVGIQLPWRSGGVTRTEALEVPRVEGRSLYGGTPADSSVIDAIVALRALGQSVMFYPFILMEQMNGNSLPDPYSDNTFQPALPWRGRITLSNAPGREYSPDGTEGAASEVFAFFGSAQSGDFSINNGELYYNGEQKWGYRRFILHYAFLCKLAGGVESFCIGSEMRGLTQIRGPEHRFPAVEALVSLAADVRAILGSGVKLSYAADWSEYFGFHTEDNIYFNLDPLWASDNIDFIGIDNYMPISDWRDGTQHADAAWRSIYNIEYLKSNIAGGEGFDWYYSGPEGVEAQNRLPIHDLGYGEDWVFRYKDLTSWWSQPHHNRINGIRSEQPTSWVPRSKPMRFTEYGCAAIDKGTNEPNKFLDPRSSESSLPRSSLGIRDDFIQMQYFRASHMYWVDPGNNPASHLYAGSMLDLDHCYAWAWDARPYPDFPRNVDLWSDGENYYRGHWLTGRATSVPLDRLVLELCEDSSLSGVNINHLYGSVHGYSVSENQSGRSALQPLAVSYAFDCIEDEGCLRFNSRNISEVIQVAECELAVHEGDLLVLEYVRLPKSEIASSIRFSYIGADGNFSAAVAEIVDTRTSLYSVLESEYPIVFPMGAAKAMASRWLAEVNISNDQVSFCLPPSLYGAKIGSTVILRGESYRIDQLEFDQKLSVKAVRVESSSSSHTGNVDQSVWNPHISSPPVLGFWMDLPILRSTQIQHAPFLAVSSNPWLAPAVLWSSIEDSGYSINTLFENSSYIGRTQSQLTLSPMGVFDRGPALLVEMPKGEMESVSLSGLLSGGNLMAIGDGDPDKWEILQYREAELISPGLYAVSMRLRGLFGSDAIMPQVWPTGSYVVLIDERIKQISLSIEELNLERHYRIGSSDQNPGSDLVQYRITAFKGIGLRPLSVAHLTCHIENQDHLFRWIRRTRVNGDSWEGYDVPLNEEREIYQFDVKSEGGEVLMSRTLDQPNFTYSMNHRLATGATGRYSVEVSQTSLIYGCGAKKTLDIDVSI